MGKRLEGAAEGGGLMGRGAFQPCGRAAEVDATPRLLHSVRLGLQVQRCGKNGVSERRPQERPRGFTTRPARQLLCDCAQWAAVSQREGTSSLGC